MQPAVSRSSAPSPRSLLPLPPRMISTEEPSPQEVTADLVLQSLFNVPTCADSHLGSDPPPGAMIAALYARVVTSHDVSMLQADLDTLIESLAESVALAGSEPRYRISNCGIGKALHVVCQIWRERSKVAVETERVQHAMALCAALIRRQNSLLLETCGVIMFHLGELITCDAVSDVCQQLICDTLGPKFRAEIRRQLHAPLAGAEVAFGLISTLRASEYRLATDPASAAQRTAADALITTLHMLIDRQPDFMLRCENSTLGLIARHGVLYLRQLAALQEERPDAAYLERQYSAARLVRMCIDEVHSRPVHLLPGERPSPPGFDRHLRYAPAYYGQWLERQEPYVRAWLALRSGEEVAPPATDTAPVIDPTPAGVPGDALAQLGETAAAMAQQDGQIPHEALARVVECVEAVIRAVDFGADRLELGTRARLLLDLDTLYQPLHRATPLWQRAHDSQPRYEATLAAMRAFMLAQTAQLVDPTGAPLLGPPVPLWSGLRSWQRLLLTQLLA